MKFLIFILSFLFWISFTNAQSEEKDSLETTNQLDEVVVSGTLKEVSKSDSPVPVEVFSKDFFQSNPTPSVFEALANVNGVRPQINCSVCNTGDIRINGLPGPYTMVLIDGLPIVSGLATVYGLSGIPQSLIERVEVVKGPASTLYGSEAVAGLINVITKKPNNAPKLAVESFATTWEDLNLDLAGKIGFGKDKKVESLIGVNYYNFNNLRDDNNDNFTDVTQQNRISLFNKWNIKRKENRVFSFAGRYVYEDRWGGELQWAPEFRGGDEVYGESIYTNRWETFGVYQLPTKEPILFTFSVNGHDQNSVYGVDDFSANQKIAFGQFTWNKRFGKLHDVLFGAAYRYTYYDDNTPATATEEGINESSKTHLPGVFIQDELKFNQQHTLLLGLRYDYNSLHGSILTPRVNYKWTSKNKDNILRLSMGNGYRIANIFTEDHAALTGAREVVFTNELEPETSWNGNLNFVKKIHLDNGILGFDFSAFYTYFNNAIFPDYETNSNQIIYDNLDGYAESKGVSLNLDLTLTNGLRAFAGATLMDVSTIENGQRMRQPFTERFTATWNLSYTIKPWKLTFDYTGNLYSPMNLPLLQGVEQPGGELVTLDPRPAESPWWSIQNIQIAKEFGRNFAVFGGVKNLLNFRPFDNLPFLIARADDPFDENVVFDTNGNAVATPNNPYALTFDPTYAYAPNQGIRGFLGLRWRLR